ncbi:MAG: tetratricopeptide repeat protein [Candidatus Goldbacteria bacterium]|nr:tetratricopeptide repeat protein [Candidatus Goldiibacteriota bacterium]
MSRKKIKKDNESIIQNEIKSEQMPVIEQKEKSGSEKIIFFILIVAILIFIYKAIDYYTGWGNMDKVVKREIESAEKNSIYKRYDTAIKIYQNLLKRLANDEKFSEQIKQIRLNLAKTYKDAEKYIDAIDMYSKLVEEYKTINNDMYAWLLLELGDCYNNILNTTEAIKIYENVIKSFPDSDWAAEAYFGIAEAYKNKKDYNNAIKYYDLIVKKYDKGFLSAEALTNKGKIFESEGKYKEAILVYKKVVDEFPEIVSEYARMRLQTLPQQMNQK